VSTAGRNAESELLAAPLWNRIAWRAGPEARVRRVLDMRAGLVHQHLEAGRRRVDAMLLSSLARPGTTVLRATAAGGAVGWGPELVPGSTPAESDGDSVMRVRGESGGVAVAASQTVDAGGALDRVAAYRTAAGRCPSRSAAVAALRRARPQGSRRC
jgi:hypothetical protein